MPFILTPIYIIHIQSHCIRCLFDENPKQDCDIWIHSWLLWQIDALCRAIFHDPLTIQSVYVLQKSIHVKITNKSVHFLKRLLVKYFFVFSRTIFAYSMFNIIYTIINAQTFYLFFLSLLDNKQQFRRHFVHTLWVFQF